MNRFSLLNSMTFVLILVVGLYTHGAKDIEEPKGDNSFGAWYSYCKAMNLGPPQRNSSIGPNNTAIAGDKYIGCEPNDPDKKDREAKCDTAMKELTTAKGQFLLFCKKEDEKPSIKDCSERMEQCGKVKSEELPMDVASQMLGVAGLQGVSFKEGACSKYTQDKLDSLIEKKETRSETLDKSYRELVAKSSEDEGKEEDLRKKINEDFIKQQEDKAEAEIKSQEDDRNKEATLDKQKKEYEAKLRQLDDDVFAAQKAQTLLISKRKADIAGYSSMMSVARIKCNAEVQKAMGGSKMAGSQSSADQVMNSKRELFAACIAEQTSKRTQDAEQFKVDMERFDRQVSNRNAEIQEVRDSLNKLTAMFSQAAADAAAKKQKDEVAFNKKQVAKWQELLTLDDRIKKTRIARAENIAKAKSNTIQASNELTKYQGQEPIKDNKTSANVIDYLGNLETGKRGTAKYCVDSKGLIPEAKTLLDSVEKSGAH